MRIRQLLERGDTIVEVLISIAVISTVMGGAFIMTNRSLQGTRNAQERVNATKLTESQVELLKNVVATNSTAVFGGSAPASFCISGSATVVASSNAACTVGVTGAATTGQPQFNIAITRATNTFTVSTTWTSIRGNATNNVQLKYRVYDE